MDTQQLLGDALRWLTGTATTKDVNSIKAHVNQVTETQSAQQETLVHIIPVLNVTRYAAQINRHGINVLMDKMDETSQDVNNFYNYFISHQPQLPSNDSIYQVSSG